MPTSPRVTDSPASRTRAHRKAYPGFDTPHQMLPANWESQVRKYNGYKRKTKKAAKKTGGRRKTRSNRH
jgi:hypothetical protein